MRELGGLDESGPPAATKSVPTTALTGIDAVDLPLAILLGASLCLFAAVVLWRRSRRGNLIWPCSGAIAAGVVATAIVGMMPELTPSFREPLSPEWRLLGINFLWIGPVEECCKLILLVWIILAAEPVRNRRGLILAALFMGLGFDIAETAFYLSLPFIPPNAIIARALPRHLLFAVITAAGLCWHAASPRWWKLWLTWLAAALAHASYNVGMLILAANFVPGMPAILDEVVPMFGVAWRALLGSTQLGLGCALLGALVLALAGAAILVRRAWRAEAEEPVSTVLPVAASG